MKRLISILLSTTLVASIAFGQEIRASFHDTPLPQALRTLSGKSGNWNINFIYDDIEDFRITADVHSQHPYEAVRQLVAALPVKVGIDSEHRIISVERATENPFMNQPTTLPTVTSEAQSSQNTVMVSTPGSLSTLLTQAQKDTCTQLTVRGKLNSADIRVLRQMGGYKEDGCSTGQLQILNLTDAEFVNDKEPYMVLDAAQEQLTITAGPGNIRQSQMLMGLPLSTGIDMYSSLSKVSNISRSDMEIVRTSGTTYYKSRFFIGKGIGARNVYISRLEHFDSPSSSAENGGNATKRLCFSDSFSEKEWKFMKKEKLTHFKGHRVVKEDGKYLWQVSSHKNFLPHDMFYKCSSLKSVLMPRGIRVDKTITDEITQVKFCLPSNEVSICYSKNFLKQKHVKLIDSDADEFIDILSKLKPLKVKKGFRIRKPRIDIYVDYQDGVEYDIYEIDVNYRYAEGKHDKFYKPSKELISKMKEFGIK